MLFRNFKLVLILIVICCIAGYFIVPKILVNYPNLKLDNWVLIAFVLMPIQACLHTTKELNSVISSVVDVITQSEKRRLEHIVYIKYIQIITLAIFLTLFQAVILIRLQLIQGNANKLCTAYSILCSLIPATIFYLLYTLATSREISDFQTYLKYRKEQKNKKTEFLKNFKS
jgi:uncharacterized membrane protein